MLMRLSAEGAAAAAAAVVASAASVASEAARGLDGRSCAGRCLPAKHTRARPTRTGAVLASFKPSLRYDYPLTPRHSASRPIMDMLCSSWSFHRPIKGDSRFISVLARFGEIWCRRSSQSQLSEPPRGPIT